MTESIKTNHTLDENGLYGFTLWMENGKLKLKLTYGTEPNHRFVENLSANLKIETSNHSKPPLKRYAGDEENFTSPLPKGTEFFTIKLGNEPLGTYEIAADGSLTLKEGSKRELTVFETRKLGTFFGKQCLPYSLEHLPKEDIEAARKLVKTDFHTHSSGEITPDALVQESMGFGYSYPVHLLHDAGIIDRNDPRYQDKFVMDDRVPFPPLEPQTIDGEYLPKKVQCLPLSELNAEQLTKLKQKMALRADEQGTHTEMEYDAYRYRYPLAKKEDMLEANLWAVAREYAKQGVTYAELSYASLGNPDKSDPNRFSLLEKLHDLVPKIEEVTRQERQQAAREKGVAEEEVAKIEGVNLRFLLGIPRTFSDNGIENELQKARVLMQSPYIVGIDFMGYEINKTNELSGLYDFVEWADKHAPGTTIRVHAGENGKNPENVREVMDIIAGNVEKVAVTDPKTGAPALNKEGEPVYKLKRRETPREQPYEVRARVGHGIYGMDTDTLELAKRLSADPANPRLVIELNPDSNMALNNIDDISEVPFQQLLRDNIPFVIGSDCNGLYQTTAAQLGMTALFAGLRGKDFTKAAQMQEHITSAQLALATQRETAARTDTPNWDDAEARIGFGAKLGSAITQLALKSTSSAKLDHTANREALATPKTPGEPSKLINYDIAKKEITSSAEGAGIKKALGARKPIAIVGASGNSWRRIGEETRDDDAEYGYKQQEKTAIAIDMLVHALDPAKAYVLQGRTKNEGLSHIVEEAVKKANSEGNGEDLKKVGIIARPHYERQDSFDNLDHLIEIKGELMDVPDHIADHVVERGGVLVAAGGEAFTRNIITKADRRMELHNSGALLLMNGPEGASTDKAQVLNTDYSVATGAEMIRRVCELFPDDPPLRPELLVPNPDKPGEMMIRATALQALEDGARERITDYNVHPANTAHQVIDGGITLGQDRGITGGDK